MTNTSSIAIQPAIALNTRSFLFGGGSKTGSMPFGGFKAGDLRNSSKLFPGGRPVEPIMVRIF